MEILSSKCQARMEEKEKLCLFYQHELQEWLHRLERENIKWQSKRDKLSAHCTELQESIGNKWSATNNKLEEEKEKYCHVIIQLLPEWQKSIERRQMKQIQDYEKRVSLIQQRRHFADIAFEKEKKLLSLLSIRQKQIQKLYDEEKQDALIREYERKSIIEQDKQYNDKLKLTETQTFTDQRLHEYIIRKEITSELEKKYNERFDHIKQQLVQNTANQTLHIRTPRSGNKQNEEEEEEKNEQIINDTKGEEGNETQPSTVEFNAEPHDQQLPIISNRAQSMRQKKINDNSDDYELTNNQNENKMKQSQIEPQQSSSDDDDDDVRLTNPEFENSVNDTSKIERAVGLIEINHASNDNQHNDVDQQALKISITTENNEQREYKAQEQKVKNDQKQNLKVKRNSKLKRSFRATTSKNRLQFSVLASPDKNDTEVEHGNHRDMMHAAKKQNVSNDNKNNTLSNVKYLHIYVLLILFDMDVMHMNI